jgi:hypothetical protein
MRQKPAVDPEKDAVSLQCASFALVHYSLKSRSRELYVPPNLAFNFAAPREVLSLWLMFLATPLLLGSSSLSVLRSLVIDKPGVV